jgi:hypothetical protein
MAACRISDVFDKSYSVGLRKQTPHEFFREVG